MVLIVEEKLSIFRLECPMSCGLLINALYQIEEVPFSLYFVDFWFLFSSSFLSALDDNMGCDHRSGSSSLHVAPPPLLGPASE